MNTRLMFARDGGECCQLVRRSLGEGVCGTAAALCALAVKNVAKSNSNFQ